MLPESGTGRARRSFRRAPWCLIPGGGLQGGGGESLPLGWQLPLEWRHVEVSAGAHEKEGGAGALSEGAEDQDG